MVIYIVQLRRALSLGYIANCNKRNQKNAKEKFQRSRRKQGKTSLLLKIQRMLIKLFPGMLRYVALDSETCYTKMNARKLA